MCCLTSVAASKHVLIPGGCVTCQIFFAAVGAAGSIRIVVATAPSLFLFSSIQISVHLALTLGIGKLLGFSRRDLLLASNANVGGRDSPCCVKHRMVMCRRYIDAEFHKGLHHKLENLRKSNVQHGAGAPPCVFAHLLSCLSLHKAKIGCSHKRYSSLDEPHGSTVICARALQRCTMASGF